MNENNQTEVTTNPSPEKNNKKLRIILIVVLVLLIGVFVFATTMFVIDKVRSSREDNANREIVDGVRSQRDQVMQDAETDTGDYPVETDDEGEVVTDSDGRARRKYKLSPGYYGPSGVLKWLEEPLGENKYLAGWLIIDGTYIDYPVVYTPFDLDYYLRRSFYGGYALSGTLYIGVADWTPEGNYTVIYGHHMKDGTMFSDLVDYESLDFARSHPNIRFETLTDIYNYEVVFAINTQVSKSTNSNSFDYYTMNSLPNEKAFNDYVARARFLSIYDTGVDVRFGDKILVLSTCNYHRDDERFIVIARYREE